MKRAAKLIGKAGKRSLDSGERFLNVGGRCYPFTDIARFVVEPWTTRCGRVSVRFTIQHRAGHKIREIGPAYSQGTNFSSCVLPPLIYTSDERPI